MATTPTIRVTRDQLAEFLPNNRTIKAFEDLFLQGSVTIPADLADLTRSVEEININAESGVERANLALGLLESISNSLDILAAAPVPTTDISTLESRLRALESSRIPTVEFFEDQYEEIQIPTPINKPIEIVTATQAVPQALTTATSLNVTSISLTAGTWAVNGYVDINPAVTTSTTDVLMGITVTSATPTTDSTFVVIPATVGVRYRMPAPQVVLQLATTTTVYLVARSTFTVSTSAATGKITAVKVR